MIDEPDVPESDDPENMRARCVRCHTLYMTSVEFFNTRTDACPRCNSPDAQAQDGALDPNAETPWGGYRLHDYQPDQADSEDE